MEFIKCKTPEESMRAVFNILRPEGVIEIRTVDKPNTYSGYFRNRENALREAINLDREKKETAYFVMNTIDEACYSRKQCEKILAAKYAPNTTSDKEIIRLRYILIDCDPIRVTGVSSSDEEKKYALNSAGRVRSFLLQEGFPLPVMADSGNGYHLLIPVDLDREDHVLVERFLKSISGFFTDERVKIDTAVSNPARICKLYGTKARKGADTKERPHRFSGIIEIPAELTPAPRDLICDIAELGEEA